METKTAKLFKYIDAKAKNRRIQIASYLSDDNELTVLVNTKRLVDFKTRHILKTETVFSYYTFRLMFEFFTLFFNDVEFKKITNRMERELEINRMSAKTNLKQYNDV